MNRTYIVLLWVRHIHIRQYIAELNPFEALDPRFKLQYLIDQGWLTSWINEVKRIIRLVYNEDYANLTTEDLPSSPQKPRALSPEWPSLTRKMTVKAAVRECDELAAFWGTPCEPESCDPIQFWKGRSVSHPDSRLVQMAIDYLSVPASSVDAERAFSRGALTVTHRHHTLSVTSTRNSIVLGGWLKDTNLVPKQELIEFFRNKTIRGQTTSNDSMEIEDSDSDSSDECISE